MTIGTQATVTIHDTQYAGIVRSVGTGLIVLRHMNSGVAIDFELNFRNGGWYYAGTPATITRS